VRAFKLALISAAAAGLSAFEPPPDFSGRWKRNETGQRMSLHGPRELRLDIRHRDPVFHYRATGVMGMDSPFVEEMEFTTDGKSRAEPAKLCAEGSWDGRALVVRYVKGGKPVATVRLGLSPDGRKLRREISLAGKPAMVESYDKQ
jgi:hypothetical protein